MRRRSLFPVLFCLWTGLALGQTQSTTAKQPTAQEKPKLAKLLSMERDYVSVTGVWQPDNPTERNKPVESVSKLSCFRYGGGSLVGTEAFCLDATAMLMDSANGLLSVSTTWLKVIEWTETQIIAADDSPICLTSQTILDLKRKTVIALEVRKSEAQGLAGACNLLPDRQTYYLQDQVDYVARKRTAK